MQPHPWIIHVAVLGFLGLLALVAQRGRPRVDSRAGTFLFRHSVLLRGFSMLMTFGVQLLVTVLAIFKPPQNLSDVFVILGIISAFAALGTPLLWESTRFALIVSPQGLDCRSPWRRGRFISWNEVKEVSYSNFGSCFVIRSRDAWKFQVPLFMAGLSVFLEHCEQQLPPGALAKAKQGYFHVGRPFHVAVQEIRLTGFDPEGEPLIRVMGDGSLYVVFEFMPPSDAPDEELEDLGSFRDFDKKMERAIGVPVIWEDREVFLIQKPKRDTIDRIRNFVEGYRKR